MNTTITETYPITHPIVAEIASRVLYEGRALDRLKAQEPGSTLDYAYHAVRFAERLSAMEALGNLFEDLTGETASLLVLNRSVATLDT